jgi:hypothetical protein
MASLKDVSIEARKIKKSRAYINAPYEKQKEINELVKALLSSAAEKEAASFNEGQAKLVADEEEAIRQEQKALGESMSFPERALGVAITAPARLGTGIARAASLGLQLIPGETGEGAAQTLSQWAQNREESLDVISPPVPLDFSSTGNTMRTIGLSAIQMAPLMAATGGLSNAMQGTRLAAAMPQTGLLAKLINPGTVSSAIVMAAPILQEAASTKDELGKTVLPKYPGVVAAMVPFYALTEQMGAITPGAVGNLLRGGSGYISRPVMETMKSLYAKKGFSAAAEYLAKRAYRTAVPIFMEGAEEAIQGVQEIATKHFANNKPEEATIRTIEELSNPDTWWDLFQQFVIGSSVGAAFSGVGSLSQKDRPAATKHKPSPSQPGSGPSASSQQQQQAGGQQQNQRQQSSSQQQGKQQNQQGQQQNQQSRQQQAKQNQRTRVDRDLIEKMMKFARSTTLDNFDDMITEMKKLQAEARRRGDHTQEKVIEGGIVNLHLWKQKQKTQQAGPQQQSSQQQQTSQQQTQGPTQQAQQPPPVPPAQPTQQQVPVQPTPQSNQGQQSTLIDSLASPTQQQQAPVVAPPIVADEPMPQQPSPVMAQAEPSSKYATDDNLVEAVRRNRELAVEAMRRRQQGIISQVEYQTEIKRLRDEKNALFSKYDKRSAQAQKEITPPKSAEKKPATGEASLYTGEPIITGKPVKFTYLRNPEKSINAGSRFQQDIEPAGRYLIEKSPVAEVPPNWETGTIRFETPLVVSFNSKNEMRYDENSWKHALSQKYGKTGKALSLAIAQDGHDGIITVLNGETQEIVDLSAFKAKDSFNQPTGQTKPGNTEPTKIAASKSAYKVESYQGGFRVTDPQGKQYSWHTSKKAADDKAAAMNQPSAEPAKATGVDVKDLPAFPLNQWQKDDEFAKRLVSATGKTIELNMDITSGTIEKILPPSKTHPGGAVVIKERDYYDGKKKVIGKRDTIGFTFLRDRLKNGQSKLLGRDGAAEKKESTPAILTYPIAPKGQRYEETDIEPEYMSPDEFLKRVRPLPMDEEVRDNVDDLKRHILSGKKLDPLSIYADGKEDGRHRAIAAKELGIKSVPVIVYKKEAAKPATPVAKQIEVHSGAAAEAFTPSGKTLKVKYAAISANNLITSSNSEFPAALQPRDRSKKDSTRQIESIAANPIVNKLITDYPGADVGTPIVVMIDGKAIVLSGNGRTEAMTKGYKDGTMKEYQKALIADADKFALKAFPAERPILVRVLEGKYSPEDLRALSVDLNTEDKLAMSAGEKAGSDATAVIKHAPLIVSNDLYASVNSKFISRVFSEITSKNDEGRYFDADGQLNKEGEARLESAVFSAAYNNPRLSTMFAEDADPTIKNIFNALRDVGVQTAQINGMIKIGSLNDLSLGGAISEAALLLDSLRKSSTTITGYFQQGQLFDDGVSALAKDVLVQMDKYKSSAKKLVELFSDYNNALLKLGDPRQKTLTGSPVPTPTRAELLKAVSERMTDRYEKVKQPGLFTSSTKSSEPTQAPTVAAGIPPVAAADKKVRHADLQDKVEKLPVAILGKPPVFDLKNPVEVADLLGLKFFEKSPAITQKHTQNILKMLNNLAAKLGIPLKAMGLDGTLGLKIENQGKRLGAYFPDGKYIVMTNKIDAIAVIHEWAHALDAFLAAKDQKVGENISSLARLAAGAYSAREEIVSAMREFRAATIKSAWFARAMKMRPPSRRPDYWHSSTEMFARATEQYFYENISQTEPAIEGSNRYSLEGKLEDLIKEHVKVNGRAPSEPVLESYKNSIAKTFAYLLPDEKKTLFPLLKKVFDALKIEKTPGGYKLYSEVFPGARVASEYGEKIAKWGYAFFKSGLNKFSDWAKAMIRWFGKIAIKSLRDIFSSLQAFAKRLGRRGMINLGKWKSPTMFGNIQRVADNAKRMRMTMAEYESRATAESFRNQAGTMPEVPYPVLQVAGVDIQNQSTSILNRSGRAIENARFKYQQENEWQDIRAAYQAIAEKELAEYKIKAKPFYDQWIAKHGGNRKGATLNLAGDAITLILNGVDKFTSWAKAMIGKYGRVVSGMLKTLWNSATNFAKSFGRRGAITIPNFVSAEQRAWLNEQKESFITNVQDRMRPLQVVQNEIAPNGLPENIDPFLLSKLYPGRLEARQEKFDAEYWQPLVDLIKSSKIKYDEVNLYLYARTAEERNIQIAKVNKKFNLTNKPGSGMTTKRADKIMKMFRKNGKMPALIKIGAQVDAITKHVNDLRIEYGLNSRNQIAMWNQIYKHYVPLKGLSDKATAEFKGQGFEVSGKDKRAAGRKSRAKDILSYLQQDSEFVIMKGEKNRVAMAFVGMATFYPKPGIYRVYFDKQKPTFAKNGQVIYRTSFMDKFKFEVFHAKMNGVDVAIEIRRPNLLEAMKLWDKESSSVAVRALNFINRIDMAVNTAYNPEFIIKNWVIDIQTAVIGASVDESYAIGKEILTGIPQALRDILDARAGKSTPGTKMFEEYKLAGGKTGFFRMPGFERRAKELRKLIDEGDPTAIQNAMKKGGAVLEWVLDMNQIAETLTRYSSYKVLISHGASKNKAAYFALNATVDFTTKGKWGAALNAIWVFAGSRIQGVARNVSFAKAMAATNRGKKLALALVLAGFVSDILNRMLSPLDPDDDEILYDKQEVNDKAVNFYIPTGGLGGIPFLKIPMSRAFGVLPEIGRNIAAAMFGPQTMLESARGIVNAVINVGNILGPDERGILYSFMPSQFKKFLDVETGTKWTGAPTTPTPNPFDGKTPDSEQFFESTPSYMVDAARFLNWLFGGSKNRPGAIDISPSTIQYLAEGFGGGMAKTLGRGADTVIRAATGKEVSVRNVPFARLFIGDTSSDNTSRIFRENYDTIAQFKKEMTDHNGDKAYVKANPWLRQMIARAEYARELIADIRDRKGDEDVKHKKIAKVKKLFNKKFKEQKAKYEK